MNRFLLILLISQSFFMTSCKREIGSIFSRKEKFEVIDPQFDYLSAKAKFKFDHAGKKVSASANFRIKKDSLIWLSITPALGIEFARVLINQDNIFILDRMSKRYYEYSFKELSSKYGFEFDYKIVQSVLLGNLLEPYQNEKIEKGDGYFAYTASKDGYLFQNFVGMNSMKLERLNVSDDSSENTISVTYGNFNIVDSQIFPNDIVAIIDYATNKPSTRMDISYNKLVIEEKPISFPFSVSAKYERK